MISFLGGIAAIQLAMIALIFLLFLCSNVHSATVSGRPHNNTRFIDVE